MNSNQLSTIEIRPESEHKYSVIWLHGLGADGHDFEGLIPDLHLASKANIHFIFPNAPIQPVTINGGRI
ncbi:MAG: carboxylesterase, partial [Bacteroidia bacterium]